MAKIKEYIKKNGEKAYQFSLYLGIDSKTGKKRRTTRRGFSTRKEARLALARLESGVDQVSYKENHQNKYVTFKDIYNLWIENYKNTVRKTTLEKTSIYFRCHILPSLGDLPIKQITFEECQHAVNDWATKTTLFPCFKNYASRVFEYAIKKEIISKNPMTLIDLPRRKKRKKKSEDLYYTQKELALFLDWIKNNRPMKEYILVRLLSYTGIRKGELAALVWDDVCFTKKTLSINKGLVRQKNTLVVTETKTDQSNRIISLDKETVKLLKQWKLLQKKQLFESGYRAKPSNEQLIISNSTNTFVYTSYPHHIMKKYPNNKLTPHGLRHTHATLLLNAGVSLKDVQKRLGHSNASTTLDIYAHASKVDSHIAKEIEKIMQG